MAPRLCSLLLRVYTKGYDSMSFFFCLCDFVDGVVKLLFLISKMNQELKGVFAF